MYNEITWAISVNFWPSIFFRWKPSTTGPHLEKSQVLRHQHGTKNNTQGH